MPAINPDVSPPNRKKAVRMKEGNRVVLEAACTIAQKHDANAILVYADVSLSTYPENGDGTPD